MEVCLSSKAHRITMRDDGFGRGSGRTWEYGKSNAAGRNMIKDQNNDLKIMKSSRMNLPNYSATVTNVLLELVGVFPICRA